MGYPFAGLNKRSSFNVGILSHFFPPDIGGIPRLHSYTVDSYPDFGVQPVVIAGGRNHTETNTRYPVLRSPQYSRAFEIRRDIRRGLFGEEEPFERSGWENLIKSLSATATAYFAEREVALVNSHIFSDLRVGFEVAKALGVPHIHIGHSSYRSESYLRAEAVRLGTRAPIITQEYVHKTLRSQAADFYIVHSYHVRDKYVRLGVPPERIRVLPPAVDVSTFQPDENGAQLVRRRLDIGSGFLLTCPSLRKGGFSELLAGFVRFRSAYKQNAYLLCCDSLDIPDEYRYMTKDAGVDDRVIFTSFAPESMPSVYSASDLVIMCSIEEGIGLPALEARACGTPVIANRFGPFLEYVEHDVDGLLVDRGDADGLAALIGRVLRDNQLRRRLTSAGVERARRYSHKLLARRYLDVFEDLIAT